MKVTTRDLITIENGINLFTVETPGGGRDWVKMKPLVGAKFKKILKAISGPLQDYREQRNEYIEQNGFPQYDVLTEKQKSVLPEDLVQRYKEIKVITSEEHLSKVNELLDLEHDIDLVVITLEDLESITSEVSPNYVDRLEKIILFPEDAEV